MFNAYLLEKQNQQIEDLERGRLDQQAKSKTHRLKTDRMAENHYKRVTNFAKDMLVWPEEISVHKNKNPLLSDVKPTASPPVPPIPVHKTDMSTRNSMDFGASRGAAATQRSIPVSQPPMKFAF